MPFTPKSWQDDPDTSTPLSAAALVDMETRLAVPQWEPLALNTDWLTAPGDGLTPISVAYCAGGLVRVLGFADVVGVSEPPLTGPPNEPLVVGVGDVSTPLVGDDFTVAATPAMGDYDYPLDMTLAMVGPPTLFRLYDGGDGQYVQTETLQVNPVGWFTNHRDNLVLSFGEYDGSGNRAAWGVMTRVGIMFNMFAGF